MYNTAIDDITPLAIANLLSMNVYIVGNPNSASTVINFRTCIQPRAIISEDRYVVIHYHAEHYSGVNIKGLLLNLTIPMASSASAIVKVSSSPIAVGTELPPCLRPPPVLAINAAISSPQTCPILTSAGGAAVSCSTHFNAGRCDKANVVPTILSCVVARYHQGPRGSTA